MTITTEPIEIAERKPYIKPEIILELELEARAGSPNSLIDPLNLTGADY